MNRLPSEGRLVLRPGLAGQRPAPGPSRYFASRAPTLSPQWEQVTTGWAVASACRVDQRQWRRLAFGQPPVPELHESDEARIEIEPHLRQSVLLALGGSGRDLAEDGKLGQLPQPIRQRRPRDAERRAERFEGLRPEERFADDQKRPCVGDNVQRARDRTIALGPDGIGAPRRRHGPRFGGRFGWLDLGGSGHSERSIHAAAVTAALESCAPLPQRRG
ncbi:hypothetical protein ACVWXO_009352 [Bradyrhizobium sp. LM2.7]